MTPTNRKGKTELVATLVVALVAVVGLVGVYSGMGSSISGAAQSLDDTKEYDQGIQAGLLCGSCVQASLNNQPLPADCSRETSDGPLYQSRDDNAKGECCKRVCNEVQGGKKCGNNCRNAASDPSRYGGSPYY